MANPAAPSESSFGSRRFVASATSNTGQMMKYTFLFILGAMAALGVVNLVLFIIGALLDARAVTKIGSAVTFCAFLVIAMPAYAAFSRRVNRPKQVLIDVTGAGFTVSTYPRDVFPFESVQLGGWNLAGYDGITKGTALHARSGSHRFVLGGRDHRLSAEAPAEAPSTNDVDAWMWADEFDGILAVVGRRSGLRIEDRSAAHPTRCLLFPRLGTFTPQPSIVIDVSDDAIAVSDLSSPHRAASGAPAEITATPAANSRRVARVGTLTMPVLIVRVGNSSPLTIGCVDWSTTPPRPTQKSKPDYRFAWLGEVASEGEPTYLVSAADWLTLVERFGLTSRMEDRDRAD